MVNCAAIPRDLVEGQLFGHEKGAFTGADSAAEGLVAQAHGGVLFLDEIGDLSAPAQASVLRVIETGTFRRIGAREESVVDIRVIAATNAEIDDAIASGRFRRDLYHRLSAFLITLPPLRERPSDVPVLAEHFLGMFRGQAKRPLRGFSRRPSTTCAHVPGREMCESFATRWLGPSRWLAKTLLGLRIWCKMAAPGQRQFKKCSVYGKPRSGT